jgi:hypothetical protein
LQLAVPKCQDETDAKTRGLAVEKEIIDFKNFHKLYVSFVYGKCALFISSRPIHAIPIFTKYHDHSDYHQPQPQAKVSDKGQSGWIYYLTAYIIQDITIAKRWRWGWAMNGAVGFKGRPS